MASIKVCDRDHTMFIEKAAGSVRVNNAVIYQSDGTTIPFQGDLCPKCGNALVNTNYGRLELIQPLNDPPDEDDPDTHP